MGSQKKAHRVTGALFLLQSGNDPVRSQPQELTGCGKAKPNAQTKRRGAAVNCAGAERARWAMQRGGGGPGNRAMCRGPVARGAARQFPGSEWSLVRSVAACIHAYRATGALFLLQSANNPVRSQPQELAGCSKAKPNAQTKRRGAAVNCAGAERARWEVQRDNFRARNGRWFVLHVSSFIRIG